MITQEELDRRVQLAVQGVWDSKKSTRENGTTLMKASKKEMKLLLTKYRAGKISFEDFSDEVQVLAKVNDVAEELRKEV
jgi:hypothetical protein